MGELETHGDYREGGPFRERVLPADPHDLCKDRVKEVERAYYEMQHDRDEWQERAENSIPLDDPALRKVVEALERFYGEEAMTYAGEALHAFYNRYPSLASPEGE